MALVPCTECSAKISDKAVACPQCGAAPDKPKKAKLWLWIPLGLIVTLFIFGLIVGSTPEAKARGDARRAIELCWEQQKDPSFEPETARFVAGACKKMENDFREKFGTNP